MRPSLLMILLLPVVALAESLTVVTSVPPLKDIAIRVAGSGVEIEALVGQGFDPHHYQPTPRQVGLLARAQLYLGSGSLFEDAWLGRIQSANAAMVVVDLNRGATEHSPSAGGGDVGDSHYWTNPLWGKQAAALIRDNLARLRPQQAERFGENYRTFAAELDKLHLELQRTLAPFKGRQFLVYHPAWGHFAKVYGLQQMSIEHEGKEPSAKGLVTLIEQLDKEGIKVVVTQPQVDKKLAHQVAREIGGEVIEADPLAADYLSSLSTMAQRMVEAMNR